MTGLMALTLVLGCVSPDTASALARGLAAAGASVPGIEVVSALDAIDDGTALGRCEDDGSARAERCAVEQARSSTATLVVFTRAYEVSGETHVALVLQDLERAIVLAREDLVGEDRVLFGEAQRWLRETLGGMARGNAPVRVFVAEPAVQAVALQREALRGQLAAVEGEIALETTIWTGIMGAGVGVYGGALAFYYAERLGAVTLPEVDFKLPEAITIAGLAAGCIILVAGIPPVEERLTVHRNRRDALTEELIALELGEEDDL